MMTNDTTIKVKRTYEGGRAVYRLARNVAGIGPVEFRWEAYGRGAATTWAFYIGHVPLSGAGHYWTRERCEEAARTLDPTQIREMVRETLEEAKEAVDFAKRELEDAQKEMNAVSHLALLVGGVA